jgi:hypothetical protein
VDFDPGTDDLVRDVIEGSNIDVHGPGSCQERAG